MALDKGGTAVIHGKPRQERAEERTQRKCCQLQGQELCWGGDASDMVDKKILFTPLTSF